MNEFDEYGFKSYSRSLKFHEVKYQTNFMNAWFLYLLSIIDIQSGSPEYLDIRNSLANILLKEKSKNSTFNYLIRCPSNTSASPYPDDLDDTVLVFLALFTHNKNLLSGADFSNLIKTLTSVEVQVGGPYNSWICNFDTDERWKSIDIGVNANVLFLLKTLEVKVPKLEKYVWKNLNKRSAFYPNFVTKFLVNRCFDPKSSLKIPEKYKHDKWFPLCVDPFVNGEPMFAGNPYLYDLFQAASLLPTKTISRPLPKILDSYPRELQVFISPKILCELRLLAEGPVKSSIKFQSGLYELNIQLWLYFSLLDSVLDHENLIKNSEDLLKTLRQDISQRLASSNNVIHIFETAERAYSNIKSKNPLTVEVHKSFAYLISPSLNLEHTAELKAYQSLLTRFFTYIIKIKKINDDLYDWQEDLANNISTQITQELQDHAEIERQQVYWKYVVPKYLKKCKRLIALARSPKLRKLIRLNTNYFERIIKPYESKVNEAFIKLRKNRDFIKSYYKTG